MTNCESCKRELLDGEHCFGPQEYEGQIGPKWVLCFGCAKKSDYTLIRVSEDGTPDEAKEWEDLEGEDLPEE